MLLTMPEKWISELTLSRECKEPKGDGAMERGSGPGSHVLAVAYRETWLFKTMEPQPSSLFSQPALSAIVRKKEKEAVIASAGCRSQPANCLTLTDTMKADIKVHQPIVIYENSGKEIIYDYAEPEVLALGRTECTLHS